MVPRRDRWLLALLAAGIALRVALVLDYRPALLSYPDTWGYVEAASGPLFLPDWFRPAGYPAFLAALHALAGSLTLVVVVQHLLGLVTAVLAYATVLALGAPRWVALVPAAATLLSLDAIYLEHALLSEALFAPLTAGALYALARALEGPASWAALAGLLVALAAAVRTSEVFVVPVLVLVALLAPGRRIRRTGALVGVAAAGMLGYAALNAAETGTFALSGGSGWATYARAAPFADCREFTPPKGTRGLCETTDVRDRGGPDAYAWGDASPGRRLFRGPPYDSDAVGAWGAAAIRAQPRAYLRAVARDLWRYVDSSGAPTGPGWGEGPEVLALDHRNRPAEALNRRAVAPYYGAYSIETGGVTSALAGLQLVARIHGPMVLLALGLSLLALPFADARSRLAMLLLGGTAVAAIVLATATTAYNWRYAAPSLPWLMASGALGAHVLAGRLRLGARVAAPAGRPAAR